MTVAGILTVTLALTMVAVALIVGSGSSQLRSNFVNQLNVSVYLDHDITVEQSTTVYNDLKALPQVRSIEYISQPQAYALFRKYFANNESLLKTTPPNAVPASYVVKLYNPQQFAVVSSAVSNVPGVEAVDNVGAYLQKLFQFLHALQLGALSVAILAMIVMALLIYVSMRVSAYSRRREIGIMRLVGANDAFIQAPFIVEGVSIGLIGAIIASLLLIPVWLWVRGHIAVGVLDTFGQVGNYTSAMPIIFGLGIVISGLMSFVTLQRHLKV